jgi:uncharacterized small protein (TIGR04563 family)
MGAKGMAGTDKQKQSLYFPEETLREIMKESIRLDRSLSWTVQQAWRLARDAIRRFPSVEGLGEAASHPPLPAAGARPADPGRHGAARERPPSQQVRDFLKGKFDHELSG